MYHIHYTYPTEGKCKQSIRNSEINNEPSLIQVCHQDGLGKRQGRQLPPRIENGTSIHISGTHVALGYYKQQLLRPFTLTLQGALINHAQIPMPCSTFC